MCIRLRANVTGMPDQVAWNTHHCAPTTFSRWRLVTRVLGLPYPMTEYSLNGCLISMEHYRTVVCLTPFARLRATPDGNFWHFPAEELSWFKWKLSQPLDDTSQPR